LHSNRNDVIGQKRFLHSGSAIFSHLTEVA
jgi:hypothetical protein